MGDTNSARCPECRLRQTVTPSGKIRTHQRFNGKVREECPGSGIDAEPLIQQQYLEDTRRYHLMRLKSAQADVDYLAERILAELRGFHRACEHRDNIELLLAAFYREHPELALPEK